ncbi:hypothetical protein ASPVEDRAFT_142292 [Aspergillus versicolor CBS 583.65]|uniref:Amidohydrolase-related domain-containing protein n=1 Tax=Aspergillus versicolor CBS 583.65 TaxID=1036611 RepID=A0A1L9Q1T8_ASPVE|nr:uncharacterized protein ASPVEDRAFT_142292 [Aspergillus versicolor CBS 583.65]OJJ07672.1 hypothetical protein ASPVEDRAFT_142292 [Aspergillus versicolor CBS 583.65]
MASRFKPSPRSRRRARRWRLPVVTAICIAGLFVYSPIDLSFQTNSISQNSFYEGLQQCHENAALPAQQADPSSDRQNPRWNPISGQKTPIILQNATLFDGESILPEFVDIIFDAGVIWSVIPSGSNDSSFPHNAEVINIHGKHVTPGLVDMHSHHLESPYPALSGTADINERPLLGPITPFVRALDGFTASDPAIRIIASGGVTSSLALPGSANIVGGEAYPVKNLPFPGADGEPVIEELLLQHGIPEKQRQRYLKMACGENPRRVYGHTRLGLAWLLRKELARAREIQRDQDAWCRAAVQVEKSSRYTRTREISQFLLRQGDRPDSFELDTLLALLRGELNVNVHCYTPEDLERMLSVLHEFGVHIRGFHHALEAWQVPGLLKQWEPNVTIATFAEHAFYKAEAFGASLRGPKILNDHGLQVALKSDHGAENYNAKYLLDQASIAHSYGLPADKALQSVTSVPARSIQQSHRIGFVRPGYDADIAVWDDHPLQVAANPAEVFIDGRPLLENQDITGQTTSKSGMARTRDAPAIRPHIGTEERNEICTRIQDHRPVLFTGITKSLMDSPSTDEQGIDNLVLLVKNKRISCLGSRSNCLSRFLTAEDFTEIPLKDGHITPGLIAFGNNLGIQEIPSEPSTGDGSAGHSGDLLDENNVHFAKYSAHLHGRAFNRARIGGVTKAVSPPHGSGVIQGVSVGIRTGQNVTILDKGVWSDDVALHLAVGQNARDNGTPTVGSGIEYVRRILEQGQKGSATSGGVYVKAANGSLPVVVQAYNQDDIAQLILIKRDFPTVSLVIYGGHGAILVAKPLAEAGIPVILTGNRGAPDTWEKKDVLPGPPLSDSPAKVLIDAGVQIGLAVTDDSKIHGLAREARWAGKYAGLEDKEAIALVSTNIEKILGLHSESQIRDSEFVVWEGDPLRGEGSVVAAVQDGLVADCWPDVELE